MSWLQDWASVVLTQLFLISFRSAPDRVFQVSRPPEETSGYDASSLREFA